MGESEHFHFGLTEFSKPARTDDQAVDPEAPVGSTITELGIERESFRGGWLVVNAKMGTEEEGWAGIYRTKAGN